MKSRISSSIAVAALLFLAIGARAEIPNISPQPGGWTFRPGSSTPMLFGDVPFPQPQPIAGSIVMNYDASHNNPGHTDWAGVDTLMILVQSFSDAAATQDRRDDSFTFPFDKNSTQAIIIPMDDRYVLRIEIAVRNASGWSGISNSSYAGTQYTGKRAAAGACVAQPANQN